MPRRTSLSRLKVHEAPGRRAFSFAIRYTVSLRAESRNSWPLRGCEVCGIAQTALGSAPYFGVLESSLSVPDILLRSSIKNLARLGPRSLSTTKVSKISAICPTIGMNPNEQVTANRKSFAGNRSQSGTLPQKRDIFCKHFSVIHRSERMKPFAKSGRV